MANESMRTSAAGTTALRLRENVVPNYYNDSANNCTFGVGTLAHLGPCTAEELTRTVTTAMIDGQLAGRLRNAESTVRLHVRRATLTQAQFDALVSFSFNSRATGARPALDAADQGADIDVVRHMNARIFIHPRDAAGHRQPAVRSTGLVNRRREEVRPFQVHQAPQ